MGHAGGSDANEFVGADQRKGLIRMLIVEDDPQVSEALEQYFEMGDFDVTLAMDGAAALEMLRQPPGFDIVLLDVFLPHSTGFEVLREAQKIGVHSPVILMSGRSGQDALLEGFGLGAQDFLEKPFDPEELLERVQSILNRTQPPSDGIRQFRSGDLVVNLTTFAAFLDDEHIKLTQLEFDVLRYLILHKGRVVTRRDLLQEVWGINADMISYTINPEVASNYLDDCIEGLRAKITADPDGPSIIETVPGLGYRLDA